MTRVDLELLLNYLDGGLPPSEVTAVVARLKTEPALAEALFALSRDQAVIQEWCAMGLEPARPYRPVRSPLRRMVPWVTAAGILLGTGIGFRTWLLPPGVQEGPIDVAHKVNADDVLEEAFGPVLALLEEVQGEAYVVVPSGKEIKIEKGSPVHAGFAIRTGEGGVAVVRLPDSTKLELGTGTQVKMPAMPEDPEGPGPSVFLVSGTIHADVPAQPAGRTVTVSTPQAIMKADLTRFSSIARGEFTSVEMESGNVEMTMRGGEKVTVPEGRYVVAGSKKGSVRNNALPPRVTRPKGVVHGSPGPALGVATTAGNLAAVNPWDGDVFLFDIGTGQTRPSLNGVNRRLYDLKFSPDGRLLAAGADERHVKFRVWSAFEGNELPFQSKRLKSSVHALAFSPDGKRLVTGGGPIKGEVEVAVWDVASGAEVGVLPGHPNWVTGVAFDPTGSFIVTVCRDGYLRVWNAKTLEMLGIYPSHPGEHPVLAISPDGKTLATGGLDGLIKLWDVETWTVRATLEGHLREVGALAFSPDGNYLASSGLMTTIWLWNVADGKPVRTYVGHRYKVTGVAFSADGKTLLTSGWDRKVNLWDVEPQ